MICRLTKDNVQFEESSIELFVFAGVSFVKGHKKLIWLILEHGHIRYESE